MILYILKRIFLLVPTLIGITFITFLIMKLAPGDPRMMKLMFSQKGMSPEVLSSYLNSAEPPIQLSAGYLDFSKVVSSKIHGNELPSEEQSTFKGLKWVGENSLFYFKWVKNILVLDFGRSFKDQQPITEKIAAALPITLLINFITIVLIYSISVPLGIWSALNKGTVLDQVIMVKLFVLYSLPTFWVATILLKYFAGGEYFDLFPLIGYKSDNFEHMGMMAKIADVAWHLVLPVVASTIGGFAFLARFSRSNFLDIIKQDFVRTARAKGLDNNTVLYKHALRNAMIPFVTLMGTLLPGLLGGSVVIEQIFNIPGMGMLSFEAVLGRDHNLIMGISTIGAFLTLLSLLISDLLYVIVDPRIRLE